MSTVSQRQDSLQGFWFPLVQIMFETFRAPVLFLGMQTVLSLYSTGRVTGVVMDSGEGVTQTVSVQDGCPLSSSICRLDLAGRNVTDHLMKMINDRGHSFTSEGF